MENPARKALESEDFAELMAEHQPRLFNYIRTLLPDVEMAKDVLQNTNIVLLKKAREFHAGTNFTAWAFRVAFFEVMTQRRRLGRDRLVFDDEAVDALADHTQSREEEAPERKAALLKCIRQLPERQGKAVALRYLEQKTITEVAEAMEMTANAVSQILFRARQNLVDCVKGQLAREGAGAGTEAGG